jgi:hypothetical protein
LTLVNLALTSTAAMNDSPPPSISTKAYVISMPKRVLTFASKLSLAEIADSSPVISISTILVTVLPSVDTWWFHIHTAEKDILRSFGVPKR